MNFSIGDRVKVIGQEIVGHVSGFNGRMVVLDDEDAETTDVKLEFYEDQLELA